MKSNIMSKYVDYQNKGKTIEKMKVSPSRRLKNLLKPILLRLFPYKMQQSKRNSYISSDLNDSDFDWLSNDIDNLANEYLENQILKDVQHSSDGDAIIVYNTNGDCQLKLIDKEHFCVPVHFARSDNGSFYWPSIQNHIMEPYNIQWHFLDRWAQA